MDVEGHGRGLPQGLDHGEAHGEVGDELAIHDVHMGVVGAVALHRGKFAAEAGEVGG